MSTLCNILGGDRYFVKMIKARVEEKGWYCRDLGYSGVGTFSIQCLG